MKKVIAVILALLMSLSLVACSGDSPSQTTNPPEGGDPTPAMDTGTPPPPEKQLGPDGQEYGGVLRIIGGDTNALIGLPWECQSVDQATLVPWTESLLLETSTGEIHPWLAESFEPDMENSEIRFKLREGVKFSDGSDFNAEVVHWNIIKSKEAGALNPAITGAEVRGEYEVAILLDGYSNSAMHMLCSATFGMVSKENYEKNGESYARENPVGTGPFVFKSMTSGLNVIFERNENYWMEGRPFLDGIEYLAITDIMTRNAAMQSTGEDAADVMDTTNAEQVALIRDSGAPVTLNNLSFGPVALYPSSINEDSPYAKLEVRQAIASAIDRQALCDARGYGILTPTYQIIPGGYKGHLENPDYITEDLALAKELLEQAGYPDGFDTTLYAASSFDRDMVVAIQSMLSVIGINAELQFPEPGAATQLRNTTGWEGMFIGTVRALPNMTSTIRLSMDPTYQFSISTWRPAEEMTPLYVGARSTLTLENGIMQDLHRLLMENMVVVPLYDTYDTFVIRENVHDTGFAEWGANTWWLPHEAWKSSD